MRSEIQGGRVLHRRDGAFLATAFGQVRAAELAGGGRASGGRSKAGQAPKGCCGSVRRVARQSGREGYNQTLFKATRTALHGWLGGRPEVWPGTRYEPAAS